MVKHLSTEADSKNTKKTVVYYGSGDKDSKYDDYYDDKGSYKSECFKGTMCEYTEECNNVDSYPDDIKYKARALCNIPCNLIDSNASRQPNCSKLEKDLIELYRENHVCSSIRNSVAREKCEFDDGDDDDIEGGKVKKRKTSKRKNKKISSKRKNRKRTMKKNNKKRTI
jgi:hypothetical protein